LAIFGTGYVGLVTGACFADAGKNVLCVDVDERKVEMLKRGESPIFEPGLDDLLKRKIVLGTGTAERRICDCNPYRSASGKQSGKPVDLRGQIQGLLPDFQVPMVTHSDQSY